jgi:hypothetical protein
VHHKGARYHCEQQILPVLNVRHWNETIVWQIDGSKKKKGKEKAKGKRKRQLPKKERKINKNKNKTASMVLTEL